MGIHGESKVMPDTLAFPLHWFTVNLVTGLAFVWIAHAIRVHAGFVRAEYRVPIFAVLATAGIQQILLAVLVVTPAPFVAASWWRLSVASVDTVLMVVSLLVTGFVWHDWKRAHG